MDYLFSILIGYLLGAIPSAYLLVKFFHNVDITKNGSGNVGALNSLEVTNSKFIGAAVLILDFLKGLLSILIIKHFFEDNFQLLVNTALFSVIGHCFSIFLKFKGGRGLATAAGSLILIAPSIFVIWVIIWLISYLYKRHIHFANIGATILTAILSFTAQKSLIYFTFPYSTNKWVFSTYITLIMIVILIKHFKPIKDYFTRPTISEVEKDEN
jgi:glycerol-3-phosphate acyltransferase PlsY